MSKKIPLEDVFENQCEFDECIYNYKGECDYGYCISEYLTYEKGNSYAICNGFELKEGYCVNCGEQLKITVDKVEYWGAMVNMESYYCPKCE